MIDGYVRFRFPFIGLSIIMEMWTLRKTAAKKNAFQVKKRRD